MCFKFSREFSVTMQPSTSEGLKPLRKMRALSGFNTWHAEYLQSAGLCITIIYYVQHVIKCVCVFFGTLKV